VTTTPPASLADRWRITWTNQWDAAALDLDGPATLTLLPAGGGSFSMIAMQAELDCRYGTFHGRPIVEFAFVGSDEGTELSGRGKAMLLPEGTLAGMFFFFQGDDAMFQAERPTRARAPAKKPAPAAKRRGAKAAVDHAAVLAHVEALLGTKAKKPAPPKGRAKARKR
jgi:hypothetical protein